MENNLSRWMSSTNTTDADLALIVGCDRTRINRLRRGKDSPSLKLAAEIERATSGTVLAVSWHPAPTTQEGEAA